MMGFGVQNSFGVFFKAFQDEFLWGRTITSGVYTAYQLSGCVVGLLTGWLTDRYGPRRTVTAGGIAIGIGLLFASRIETPLQLYLVYSIFLSFGISVAWVPLMATVSRWFIRKRGLALGLVGSGVGLGTATVPLLAGYLITTVDWRFAYVSIGLAAIILITSAAVFLKRDPDETGTHPYGEETNANAGVDTAAGISLTKAIRNRNLWMLFFTFMMVCIGTFMVMTHITRYALDAGLNPMMAAGIVSAIGIGNIFGKTSMGSISDRIGIRPALVICLVGQGLVMLLLNSVSGAIGFYVTAVLFGFFFGGWVPLFPALTGAIFGVRYLGMVFSFVTLGSGIGSALGPVIAGYVYDTTQSYFIAFTTGALLSLAAAIVLPLLKSTGQETPTR
jgi:MFS family permease